MSGKPHHLLILVILAVHGAVSVCGPGAHLLVIGNRVESGAGDPSVRAADPCPICEWSGLGVLPVGLPRVGSVLVSARVVAVAPPQVVAEPPVGSAQPRAPPGWA